MTNEEIISAFLQTAYTDERLAALLAHAEDGRLSFLSCCCVAGIPTAQHVLRGIFTVGGDHSEWREHGPTYADVPMGHAVSKAFGDLAEIRGTDEERDAERRTKLIPLIKAEMARRESLRSESTELTEVTV